MSWSWETGTVESAGERIYYEAVNDDPAFDWVVLTHGAGGSHASWWQQVVAFAPTHRVITWDCRGSGNSTFRTGAFNASVNARDLVAVLDQLGVERAHLIGQSMGGWWVTELAVTAPERVLSLTLADSIGGLFTDELDGAFRSYAASAQPPPRRVGAHPALDVEFVEHDLASAFLFQQLATFFEPPRAEMAEALFRDRRTHAELDETELPVLVLAGSDDPIFPAPLLVQSAALLARGEYVEIDGGGHVPYFSRAPAWNAAVLEFLKRSAR